ncbi:MAG: S8 family serine peptidase, partial [Bacteroidota bacterium]
QHFVGAGLVDNINNGIKWAVDQGAQVINMSLGIPHEGGGLPHQEVITYAHRKGATVVAASGNDGTDERYYPGALKGVIAVGALEAAGQQVASYTSFGKVTLLAPGTQVYSTHVNGGYAFASGTSQAAPFVAGIVALLQAHALKKYGQLLSYRQVRSLLIRTADRPGTQEYEERAGFGRINPWDAFRQLDYSKSKLEFV